MRLLVAVCLAAMLCGCGANSINGFVAEEGPDSIRLVTPDRDYPYALLWRNGKINIWTHQTIGQECGIPVIDTLFRMNAVYSGTIMPDSVIHFGQLADAYFYDDTPTILSSTLTGSVVNDTLYGQLSTTVQGPCGPATMSQPFILVRAN
jgi:hypothetical protein